MKKRTTEEFITEAKRTHGDKYDYSKVNYVNSQTKVCIICPKHGEFYISPSNFLFGQGCKKCGIERRATNRKMELNDFISKAKNIHGEKYDYSKVEYKNGQTKVCIICPKHGEFWQMPEKHLQGCGCPKCCKKNRKYTTKEFVEEAYKVHKDKYNYSKVEYKDAFTKICIICPEHGEFWQSPSAHLQGCGCPKCKGRGKTTESFIEELKSIHGNKYDYSNVVYNGAFNPVRLICEKHGEFITTPHSLLSGCGCKKCGEESTHEKQRLSTEEFIKRARNIHGDKYDYSKVEYVNAKTPVCVVCPKHGEFWVAPNSHISSKAIGCPKCSESVLETQVRVFCENNSINFIQQKTFKWLKLQRLDFYLPEYNVAIECQGYYHFNPHYMSLVSNSNENLLAQIKRDEIKYELCEENGVKILYYVPENLIKDTKISKIYTKNNIISTMETLMRQLKIAKQVCYESTTPENDWDDIEDRINHEHKASPKETAATILKHIDGHEKMSGGTKNIIESEKYTDPEYTEGEVISNIASLQPDAML